MCSRSRSQLSTTVHGDKPGQGAKNYGNGPVFSFNSEIRISLCMKLKELVELC